MQVVTRASSVNPQKFHRSSPVDLSVASAKNGVHDAGRMPQPLNCRKLAHGFEQAARLQNAAYSKSVL
jgi:hypothetical protein